MSQQAKLIRITTVPISLLKLLEGQLSFMNNSYQVIAVSSGDQLLEKVKEQEGVGVFAVNMTRKITPLKDLFAVWRLYKYFRKEKPLIVHTHTPKAGTVGMIAAKLAGVPNRLHTVAGLPLMEARGIKRRILDTVEKITYSCASKVYPNSTGLYNFIVQHNLTTPGKLKVIANGSSNGINCEHFNRARLDEKQLQELRVELHISPDDFVFIFIGRLVSDKGLNELVGAFKQLCISSSKVKLILVGPFEDDLDPLNKHTQDEITKNTAIKHVGFRQDVRPYLAISDCLVFPSYREGFPNVVMQAGAMGLPSIVSDINGCNEIIVEGRNGMIVPVKDEKALYHSMVKILMEEDVKTTLKKHAREMIQNRYDQKFLWNALLEEYKQCAH